MIVVFIGTRLDFGLAVSAQNCIIFYFTQCPPSGHKRPLDDIIILYSFFALPFYPVTIERASYVLYIIELITFRNANLFRLLHIKGSNCVNIQYMLVSIIRQGILVVPTHRDSHLCLHHV